MRRRSGLAIAAVLALAGLGLPWGRAEAPLPPLWRTDLKPLAAEGLSALWMAPDGSRLIALSDRSFALSAQVDRDAEGRIAGIREDGRWPLFAPRRPGASDLPIDSEGIAVGAEGEIFVSTEGPARVLRIDGLGAETTLVAGPRDFRRLAFNGALEGLAIGPDGTLFTLPETPPDGRAGFPIYRRRGGEWSVLAELPAKGGMAPVGADIGPDGKLYVLYRDFSPLQGFASLLQRHTVGPEAVGAAETLMQTGFGQLGNLEGISVWRRAGGGLVASMITDDNGLFVQDAALIEVALPE